MDKQTEEKPTPPRFVGKWKIATLTLLFLVIFFSVGYASLEGSSKSEFCVSCHEMAPEYYTWNNSAHSEVDCVDCHTEPGVENVASSKLDTVEQAIKKQMKTYEAPIRMPSEITDASCEKCHNVYNRNFTVSGDIIIPHDKHKAEEVSCTQCHSGIAHGKIADRKMTYKTDYIKWDDSTGASIMSDQKFVKPDMETCMECHRAKDVTTECSACHTTGMVPDSHKDSNFVNGKHGKLAESELAKCIDCHTDMSTKKVDGYEELSVIDQYLSPKKQVFQKNHINYARENTYCVDCHNKRPESHTADLIRNHGTYAQQNKETCIVCHEVDQTVSTGLNKVNCSSCHSKKHAKNWRQSHPVPVPENQKVQQTCYSCHVEKTCTNCHKDSRGITKSPSDE